MVWGGTHTNCSPAPSRERKKKSPFTADSQWIILGNYMKSTRIFRNLIIFMVTAVISKINKIIPTLREFADYRECAIT